MRDGVLAVQRDGLALAYLLVRAGAETEFEARMAAQLGMAGLPHARRVAAGNTTFVWAARGRWLAVAEGLAPTDWSARLATALADIAAVSQQSSAWVIVRLWGPRVREALAKLCPVDLHPTAFTADAVALTRLGHVAVHLWRLGQTDAFEIAVQRSYFHHTWAQIVTASAEYGLREPAGPPHRSSETSQ